MWLEHWLLKEIETPWYWTPLEQAYEHYDFVLFIYFDSGNINVSDTEVILIQSPRKVIRVEKGILTKKKKNKKKFLAFCFLQFYINPHAEQESLFLKMVSYIS